MVSPVEGRVAGKAGVCEKVKAAALKPIGELKVSWTKLFETKRGRLVEPMLEAPANDWSSASNAERDAAWAAFKALTRAGWRSDDAVGGANRDELHER